MILKQDLGELWFKVNYYGPGLAGKTTNLEFLWESFHQFQRAGEFTMLAEETDRTLLADLSSEVMEMSRQAFERRHRRVVYHHSEEFNNALPKNQARLDFGSFGNLKLHIRLHTVPGPVFYDESRRKSLEGTDGVVFIADSQNERMEANVESLDNLKTHLRGFGRDPEQVPLVFQFNKRDLRNVLSLDGMNQLLNPGRGPWFEAVAYKGIGVLDTLHALVKLMLRNAGEALKSRES